MFQTVNNTSGERWPTFGIVQYVSNGRQTCNCLLVHTINFMVRKETLLSHRKMGIIEDGLNMKTLKDDYLFLCLIKALDINCFVNCNSNNI